MRNVVGELPDLPHLPELPARGAGADLIGRTAALLSDLRVDLQPGGWRLSGGPAPGATSAGPWTCCAATSTPWRRRPTGTGGR